MAQFYGKRSQYSVRMAWLGVAGALAYGLIGWWTLYIMLKTNIAHLLDPIFLIVMLIIYAPIFWLILYQYKKEDNEANNFFQGLRGEDAVANDLKKLPEAYSVFSDVLISGKISNIDFVLVGPTGIYAIEVKSHRGAIGFNGSDLIRNGEPLEKDFLRQAKSEALSLHDYLKDELNIDIYVKPVIVFSRARLAFGLKPLNDVFIIQKQWIQKLVNTHPFYRYTVDRKVIEEKLKGLVAIEKPEQAVSAGIVAD